ncbi:hypothetical protein [Streptomyces bacillaris]|uniref:hypothetical protein n=1 Tax=Streptomyces bacillaris TaxID=68179 RepID=UPI0036647C38
MKREGAHRPVPRCHTETITIDGEPVTMKLGVWISNTKSRWAKLTSGQRAAIAALGVPWAQTSPLPPPSGSQGLTDNDPDPTDGDPAQPVRTPSS